MTSKQRAYLKSLAMKMDPIMQLGKGSVTPENTASVDEALAARERTQFYLCHAVGKHIMRNLDKIDNLPTIKRPKRGLVFSHV